MSNISSSKKYIQVEETRFRSAVSESLEQKIGGSINYLNDQDTLNTARILTAIKKTGSFSITPSTTQLSVSTSSGANSVLLNTSSTEMVLGSISYRFDTVGTTVGDANPTIFISTNGTTFNLSDHVKAASDTAISGIFLGSASQFGGSVSPHQTFSSVSQADAFTIPLFFMPESSDLKLLTDPLGTSSSFKYRLYYQKFAIIT